MTLSLTYAVYLAISFALTIWVGRTLHSHGRLFLLRCFAGNDSLADAVNHLLLVGFYLVNFGYVCLALRFGDKPSDLPGAIEFLATKVGLVLLILGGMHFFNLFLFTQIGREKRRSRQTKIPFAPALRALKYHPSAARYETAQLFEEMTHATRALNPDDTTAIPRDRRKPDRLGRPHRPPAWTCISRQRLQGQ